MKIVCLKGGLGNQMFEYCRYMEMKAGGHDVRLYYDRRRLNVHGGVQLDRCFELSLPPQSLPTVAAVLALKAGRALGIKPWLYDDCDERAVLIDDYCQELRFVANAARWLKFRPEVSRCVGGWAERIAACAHPVAVHYRRGDYLHPKNLANFGLCPPEYYERARRYVLGRHPDARFFVFSDDTDWAEANAPAEAAAVVRMPKGAPDYAAMYLMSRCRSHIIANSTFSYWGAALSAGEGAKVRPARWFAAKDWTAPDIFDYRWVAF